MNVIAIARKTVIAGLIAGIIVPVVAIALAYGRFYLPGITSAVNPRAFPRPTDRDLLANSQWGWYRVIDFANRYLPENALVLVFRQNDFVFYGRHRVIRDTDPRMIPVYRQPGKEEAYRALLELGVGFFYLPEYSVPTMYNTPVGAVLADPEMVRLVFEDHNRSLYRLLPPSERRPLTTQVVFGKGERWMFSQGSLRWRPVTLPFQEEPRDSGTNFIWLHSGHGDWEIGPTSEVENQRIEPGSTLRLRGRFRGKGWLMLSVIEYSRNPIGLRTSRPLHQGVLTDKQFYDLDLQLRANPSAESFRFLITLQGEGPFTISSFQVDKVGEPLPYGISALGPDHASVQQGLDEGLNLRLGGNAPVAVFTGPGHFLVPPSIYGIGLPRMAKFGEVSLYRVQLEVRGSGHASLAAVSFDVDGTPRTSLLETIGLSPETTVMERVLVLPPEAREFRFGLMLAADPGEGLVGWVKRFVWRQLPPESFDPGSLIVVRKLSLRHEPQAIDDPAVRDCLLKNVKSGKANAASLCQR